MSNTTVSVSSGIDFKGVYKFTLRNAETGKIEGIHIVDNLVPNVALNLVASLLGGSSSANAGKISHCAVGTSTTAPASGDTALGAELYRNSIGSLTYQNSVVYATGFFQAGEGNGTLREAGIFINGTATPNSGTLLSKVAINITKTGTQTLTLEWTLTISNT